MNISALIITEVGLGLSHDASGRLSVDADSRIVWTDTHTFVKPIVLSSNQKISVSALTSDAQKAGSVVSFDGSAWRTASPASPGLVLTSSMGQSVWSPVDLHSVTGVLDVRRGGTGLKKYMEGEMVFASSPDALATLPIGAKGWVLMSNGTRPYWGQAGTLGGKGKLGHVAVWDGTDRLASGGMSIRDGNVILSGHEASVELLSQHGTGRVTMNDDYELKLEYGVYSHLKLGRDSVEIGYPGGKIVAKDGMLQGLKIPVADVRGILPIASGGTGAEAFEYGGVVVVSEPNKLGTLSTKHADGKVLGVVRGSLAWVVPNPHDPRAFGGRPGDGRMVVPDAESKRTAVEGTLERVRGQLFYVDSQSARRRVMLEGFEFSGTAENVRGIVDMRNGGTNADLSALNPGHLLMTGKGRIEPVAQGDRGLALVSAGYDRPPVWSPVVRSLSVGVGLHCNVTPLGDAEITVDADRLFSKAGNFPTGVQALDAVSVAPRSGVHLKLAKTSGPAAAEDGDLWYDGREIYMRKGGVTEALGAKAPTPSQMLYIPWVQGLTPNEVRFRPHLVPHGPDGVTACTWMIKRVDLFCSQVGHDGEARMSLSHNGAPALDPHLSVPRGARLASAVEFTSPYVRSGDILELDCIQSGGSDGWSVFLTLLKTE